MPLSIRGSTDGRLSRYGRGPEVGRRSKEQGQVGRFLQCQCRSVISPDRLALRPSASCFTQECVQTQPRYVHDTFNSLKKKIEEV